MHYVNGVWHECRKLIWQLHKIYYFINFYGLLLTLKQEQYIKQTSAILVAKIRKSPNIAKPDCTPNWRHNKVQLRGPCLTFVRRTPFEVVRIHAVITSTCFFKTHQLCFLHFVDCAFGVLLKQNAAPEVKDIKESFSFRYCLYLTIQKRMMTSSATFTLSSYSLDDARCMGDQLNIILWFRMLNNFW